jgi:hypothetical protein
MLSLAALMAFSALLAISAPASANIRALATNAPEIGADCAQFSDQSPPIAKDADGNEVGSANVGELVIIFSTFSNPCNHDQQTAIITEARTEDGTTAFFQSVEVSTGAFNSTEVGSLWWPERAGAYELRSFAISNFTDSKILTDIQTSKLLVVDYDSVDYDFNVHTKTLSAR